MFRRRNSPLIARVLLALTLLVAQSAAQAHAHSHRFTDLAGAPSTQLCSECLCFAPLLTVAGGSDHVLLIPRGDVEPITRADCLSAPPQRHYRAFQPRAPPPSL
ncbi:MAG: hypothetical protein ACRETT_05590 [Steroidobacteraceae bacterium]